MEGKDAGVAEPGADVGAGWVMIRGLSETETPFLAQYSGARVAEFRARVARRRGVPEDQLLLVWAGRRIVGADLFVDEFNPSVCGGSAAAPAAGPETTAPPSSQFARPHASSRPADRLCVPSDPAACDDALPQP
eukprot:TRINITY_DN8081_c0_g1_i3.p2 TRINITY_DN8081_c0_g1~~TRINITY_DN8081_c0_g1_i3.p2  ORF type:complete len:134 (+),score=10.91 TRINITY_DN8081_c0_g1_i3:42-443(+)